MGSVWPDWAIAQLQERYMNGVAPEATASLLGTTKDEVCAKARELGLVLPTAREESPSSQSDTLEIFPRDIAAS
jgi:hypothetical protein